MSHIVMGRAGDPHIETSALLGMFRLRDTVFHKRLGWDVDSRDGLEMDRYDELDPVYMLAHAAGTTVDGCWRLLPTLGDYMLRDTFPALLRG
ncbi:MAG: acyl-homoserine-lactone synthase, partial [Planctomycetes bacterium]|nr:acyl-homoserine-lactone synthase [Planctomycetota bacterium]